MFSSLSPPGLPNRCPTEGDLFFLPVSLISVPALHSQRGSLRGSLPPSSPPFARREDFMDARFARHRAELISTYLTLTVVGTMGIVIEEEAEAQRGSTTSRKPHSWWRHGVVHMGDARVCPPPQRCTAFPLVCEVHTHCRRNVGVHMGEFNFAKSRTRHESLL